MLINSITNNVQKFDDKVVKKYNKHPITAFIQGFTNSIGVDPKYPSRRDRMKSECQTKKELKSKGVKTPEIIDKNETSITFEKIEGQNGYNYLSFCSSERATQFGENIGKIVKQVHEENIALKDIRISNFVINEQGIYSIDHEYSKTSNDKLFFQVVDLVTLFGSVRQTDNYEEFIEGFEKINDVPTFVHILSFFASFILYLISDRGLKTLEQILQSCELI